MAKTKKKLPVKRKSSSKKAQSLSTSWHPIESLRREIDRLFENFSGGFFDSPARHGMRDLDPFRGFDLALPSPAMDISEKKGSYEISAELPGMDENHIELNLSDGILTFSGEKTNERKEEEEGYYFQERHYGSFRRSATKNLKRLLRHRFATSGGNVQFGQYADANLARQLRMSNLQVHYSYGG